MIAEALFNDALNNTSLKWEMPVKKEYSIKEPSIDGYPIIKREIEFQMAPTYIKENFKARARKILNKEMKRWKNVN